MKELMSNLFKGDDALAKILLLAIALFALGMASFAGSQGSGLVLWGLGAAILYPYFKEKNSGKCSGVFCSAKFRKISSAILLLVAFCAMYFNFTSWAAAAVLLSVILYFGNFKIFACAIFPVLIWYVAVPNIEAIQVTVAYPMRMLATVSSTKVLALFGFDISSYQTMIYLKGSQIAITSACSGIEQLEAMLLLGYIWVLSAHKNFKNRIFNYIMIVPVILFCNTLRLIITLVLINFHGISVISDTVHSWLGIGMVALSFILMIAFTPIFAEDKEA